MSAAGGHYSRDDLQVCIVGCGAVSPLGYSAPMTAASVRANLSRFRESRFVDKVGQPVKMSAAEVLADSSRGLDRLAALALPALQEAVAAVADDGSSAVLQNAAFCLGTASPRPGFTTGSGRGLLERLATPLSICVRAEKRYAVAAGHASWLIAVERACQWIVSGAETFVLVGGVDSYYDAETLEWLDHTRRLHSDVNVDGFVPGEAAGFCLLTSIGTASRYGLTPLAVILAPAATREPYPMTSDGVCLGEGLTQALRKTLTAALVGGGKADWTLCDMNGESFRGTEWVYAYVRTGRQHRDPLEIWHPADCYGDVGAASGALLASLAIEAWRRNYARGDRALIWTASDGHERAAAVLAYPQH
jgi:3-oxoacyl-[acyl-carrier-protein] synthase-1